MAFAQTALDTAPYAVSLEGIRKSYEGREVLSGLTLAVRPGEFLAIVGPSGCGKSSLLYLLGLIDRPSRGGSRAAKPPV